jgi:hypothetical protein
LNRHLYPHVLSSTIHKSQDVEGIQKPMSKENMAHAYTVILLHLQKETNSITCYNTNKP